MSKKQKYSLDKFRELVQAGKSRTEIMAEMEIKGYPQFAALELRLFKTDDKVYKIPAGPNKTEENNIVTIGQRGNITIPAKIMETTKFQEGDSFTVTVRGAKITLTLNVDKD